MDRGIPEPKEGPTSVTVSPTQSDASGTSDAGGRADAKGPANSMGQADTDDQTRHQRSETDDSSAKLEQALEQARVHARAAVGESVRSARALLDAASLVWSARPAAHNPLLQSVARRLDELADSLEQDPHASWQGLVDQLHAALDREIERWEQRSLDDDDAQTVLRAFLSLRKALWPQGVPRDSEPPGESKTRSP